MGTSIRIERMQESHIPHVLEFEKIVNPSPWSENSLRSELKNSQANYLVAIKKDKVVGFCGFWIVIDEAHVTNISVAPDFQRQGIGSVLMNHLLKIAKELGVRCSTLEVRAGNTAAIRLYESLGYSASAIRRKYYPDNQEDAVVMWKHDVEVTT